MSVLQKYLSGAPGDTPASVPTPAAAAPQAPLAAATARGHTMTAAAAYMPHNTTPAAPQAAPQADPRARDQGRAPPPNRGGLAHPPRPLAAAPSGYSSDSDHSRMNGTAGDVDRKETAAGGGGGGSDDMDMSPIVEHEKGDALDSKALAKLPAQV